MTSNTQLVLHERANGVICNNKFYPYLTYRASDDIPAKKNVRYFVKAVVVSLISEGICATDYVQVTGKINGVTCYLVHTRIAAQTQAVDFASVNSTVPLGVLLDRECPIDLILGTSNGRVVVVYAEIDDV